MAGKISGTLPCPLVASHAMNFFSCPWTRLPPLPSRFLSCVLGNLQWDERSRRPLPGQFLRRDIEVESYTDEVCKAKTAACLGGHREWNWSESSANWGLSCSGAVVEHVGVVLLGSADSRSLRPVVPRICAWILWGEGRGFFSSAWELVEPTHVGLDGWADHPTSTTISAPPTPLSHTSVQTVRATTNTCINRAAPAEPLHGNATQPFSFLPPSGAWTKVRNTSGHTAKIFVPSVKCETGSLRGGPPRMLWKRKQRMRRPRSNVQGVQKGADKRVESDVIGECKPFKSIVMDLYRSGTFELRMTHLPHTGKRWRPDDFPCFSGASQLSCSEQSPSSSARGLSISCTSVWWPSGHSLQALHRSPDNLKQWAPQAAERKLRVLAQDVNLSAAASLHRRPVNLQYAPGPNGQPKSTWSWQQHCHPNRLALKQQGSEKRGPSARRAAA